MVFEALLGWGELLSALEFVEAEVLRGAGEVAAV
jgi:hypothetical protein